MPWSNKALINSKSIDMIMSQAVLEHIEDLLTVFRVMDYWLKPSGLISHAIDFKSHGTSDKWNGHWEYSPFAYLLLSKDCAGSTGGAERQFFLFGRELEKKGWRVSFITERLNYGSPSSDHEFSVYHADFSYLGGSKLRMAYCWAPATPSRIVFYGALSGKENEMAALRCANRIMPLIWARVPDAELWLVGANPTKSLRYLQTNSHIKVTGFVDQVQDVLSKATVMLCPLKGKYGFRSRLIEAMALGVPLCVTSDAVYGMGLEDGKGITVHDSDDATADAVIVLLNSPDMAKEQSLLARKQVEEKFSFEETYGRIVSFLLSCASNRSEI